MSLRIIKAGIFDTIQDTGRFGYRHLGINPTGAMDNLSAKLANALLGKRLEAALIEMHFPAPVILFQKPTIACLAGADFSAMVNNQKVPVHQPFFVAENSVLRFERLMHGARCYLSLFHDLQIDNWLQSASTHIKAEAGGWNGRRLKTEDVILFRPTRFTSNRGKKTNPLLSWKTAPLKINKHLDCIKGNEWAWLEAASQHSFKNSSFQISNLSDRMGYRLYGEQLRAGKDEQLVSSAVDFGTVQLLPNGQMIILMADHQTTGGYPRLAHITSTALSSLAQLNPNEAIQFRFIEVWEAEDNLLQQYNYLQQLQNACKLKIEKYLHASM